MKYYSASKILNFFQIKKIHQFISQALLQKYLQAEANMMISPFNLTEIVLILQTIEEILRLLE